MGLLGSLPDRMARVDARIASAIGEVAIIKGKAHQGHFFEGYREVALGDGKVAVLAISFDCAYTAEVARLLEQDLIEVERRGKYRFLQRLPDRGTGSGWVSIELGRRQL